MPFIISILFVHKALQQVLLDSLVLPLSVDWDLPLAAVDVEASADLNGSCASSSRDPTIPSTQEL
jgi:hypothetical protein